MLSGNRNFEGRVNPQVRANYLASPLLVVAYALAGSLNIDLPKEPLGYDKKGKPVYLKDIWPSTKEIADTVRRLVKASSFRKRYANVFAGDATGARSRSSGGQTYDWDSHSTYVQNPPYFDGMPDSPSAVEDDHGRAHPGAARRQHHHRPHLARRLDQDGRARPGQYLIAHGVPPADFNSYGARRGNHEVMMRGTFANIRIRNEMMPGTEGGITRHLALPARRMSIYDAAMRYKADGRAAGGRRRQGIRHRLVARLGGQGHPAAGRRAVIAESFERIHRSNLIGMGVLPLQFKDGVTRKTLGLTGEEIFDLGGLRRRHQAAHGGGGDPASAERPDRELRRHLPDRYARRGRIFPPRRHPALRAAQSAPAGGLSRGRAGPLANIAQKSP